MGQVPRLRRNAVHCNICQVTIESFHRHDFVRCACREDDTAVWVDGGHDYARRMMGNLSNFTEIDEEFVPEGPAPLEHSDVTLKFHHHRGQCAGQSCTIHNRSNHSKRSWVQHWNSVKGRMERISPTTGRHYKDPDSP